MDYLEVAELSNRMLPNPSVVDPDESPEEAAEEAVRFWEDEAQRDGEALFDQDEAGQNFRRKVLTHIMGRILLHREQQRRPRNFRYGNRNENRICR